MKTEAKVGAFVLISAAILLVSVYRITSAQIRGARVSYRSYLRYAGGLEPGADVLFGGITVGAVTAVRPDAQDPTRIEILMDLKQGTPVNAKCVARLGSVTLVTNPVMSISTGTNEARRLPPGSEIPAEETISMDDAERKVVALADSARTLMDSLQTDVKDAQRVIANLNNVTGKPNQQRVANILANADSMVARSSPKVDQISDQLVRLTNEANAVMAKVGPALDNANATVSNANATISSLRQPAQVDLEEVRKTLVDLQAQMRAKDQDLTYTLENVRMITDNLNELTESVKERPWSLIRIREPKDRKVPAILEDKP
jgi:phospholipid/cholesterol/gamma-HCH transport system substrate-binding protein